MFYIRILSGDVNNSRPLGRLDAVGPIAAGFSMDEHNFGERANDQHVFSAALKTVLLKIACE